MFQTIGIFAKQTGIESWSNIDLLIKFIQEKGRKVLLDEVSCKGFPNDRYGVEILSREELAKNIDLAIVVGGDGTFLNVARFVADVKIPIVGINLGRLGFLTDISPDNMLPIMDEILHGTFDYEERNLLSVEIYEGDKKVFEHIAFNDVVIHKTDMFKMIEFETFIDGRFLKSQRSDGMIIATPTGSTAYSLSAGGPILDSGLNVISLVSINPHTISNRPFVVSGDSKIELRAHENCQGKSGITCDGQETYITDNRHCTHIQRHPNFIKMLHPAGHDHYQLLRTKLHWGDKI